MRTSQRELFVALPFRVYGEQVFQLVRFPKNVLLSRDERNPFFLFFLRLLFFFLWEWRPSTVLSTYNPFLSERSYLDLWKDLYKFLVLFWCMFCLMYDDFVWRGELDAFNKWEQYKWHTAKCRVTFNTRGYHKKNQKKYFPISHAPETLLSGSFFDYNKARFVIFR